MDLVWGDAFSMYSSIFFIECGEKIIFFEKADIFTARDEIYLMFAEKNILLLILYTQEK